jgi:hypothetical protein
MMNREKREGGIERAAAERKRFSPREHRRRRSNRPLPNHFESKGHSYHRHLRGLVRSSTGADVDYAPDITERLRDHHGHSGVRLSRKGVAPPNPIVHSRHRIKSFNPGFPFWSDYCLLFRKPTATTGIGRK